MEITNEVGRFRIKPEKGEGFYFEIVTGFPELCVGICFAPFCMWFSIPYLRVEFGRWTSHADALEDFFVPLTDDEKNNSSPK